MGKFTTGVTVLTTIYEGDIHGMTSECLYVCFEFKESYASWKLGEITAVKAMQEIGVKKTTFYKLVREYEETL